MVALFELSNTFNALLILSLVADSAEAQLANLSVVLLPDVVGLPPPQASSSAPRLLRDTPNAPARARKSRRANLPCSRSSIGSRLSSVIIVPTPIAVVKSLSDDTDNPRT